MCEPLYDARLDLAVIPAKRKRENQPCLDAEHAAGFPLSASLGGE